MSAILSPRQLYRRYVGLRDSLFVKQVNRDLRRRDAEAFSRLERLIDRYRGAGGLSHPLQVYKLRELERLLEQKAPSRILEMGTGSTTPILAAWALAGERRQLLAIDEDEEWLEVTRRLLPAAALDALNVRLEHRDKLIRKNGGTIEVRYDPTVDGDFDLVVVDGPSLSDREGKKLRDAVNTNVADLIARSAPAAVVVDIRAATVRWFEAEYSDLYRSLVSHRVQAMRVMPYRYWTVFNRRDGGATDRAAGYAAGSIGGQGKTLGEGLLDQ